MPVIVNVVGGLGNQLFQYAFGRRAAITRGDRLLLDVSFYNRQTTNRALRLTQFNIDATLLHQQELARYSPSGTWRRVRRRIHRLTGWRPVYDGVHEMSNYSYTPEILTQGKYPIYVGYWAHPGYIEPIAQAIRAELAFSSPPDAVNQQWLEHIAGRESVSLHVRRGDYLLERNLAYHGVLPLSYYHSAIANITRYVKTPSFYLFSDDPQWVKENLILDYPVFVMEHNGDEQDYEDLRLMSACQHHIIANSTFSWWGAWLSEHAAKRVIAPERWNRDLSARGHIAPDDWILL